MRTTLQDDVTVVGASKRYRAAVMAALARGGWSPELEQDALAAAQRLARARQQTLSPTGWHAALVSARTLFFIVAPLLAADWAWQAGWRWGAVPLVVLAGLGLYGGVAILHDMAHGSFVPSRRLNAALGQLLAPLLLMEFTGFRRSHLDHHRHSQSTDDPKRFGVEHREGTTDPEHSSLPLCPAPIRGPLRAAAKLIVLPVRLRQLAYLIAVPIVMGPAVLFFSGEFSVARRDWRRRESWTASIASAVFLALLYAWSPALLVLFVIALLVGHSFTFHVFAAHLTAHQVYWTSARKATLADALNVSDIHCGALPRWLGLGLSNYHSLHHLSPAIPCYRLPAAEAMMAPALQPLRAPSIDLLDPLSCAVLFDAVFHGVVYKNKDSWDYAGGGGMRRIPTPDPGAGA